MSDSGRVFPDDVLRKATMSSGEAIKFMIGAERVEMNDPETGVGLVAYQKDGKVMILDASVPS